MPPAEAPNPWDDPLEPVPVWDLDAVAPAEPVERAEVVPTVECWRCGTSSVPTHAGKCQKCKARIADAAQVSEPDAERERDEWLPQYPARRVPRADSNVPSLVPVFILYSLFLLVSVIWGWVLLRADARLTEHDVQVGMAAMEVMDTILVVVGLVVVAREVVPRVPPGTRGAAWGLAVPACGLLIGVNVAYMAFIRELVRPGFQPPEPPLTALTLILICVQPAIVEELFFRYVAFGALLRVTGVHTTVWLTGVMFSVAHIYNPLGMPYLFLAGAVFGYARAWGGLALPMVMHFLHNLAVLLIEGA